MASLVDLLNGKVRWSAAGELAAEFVPWSGAYSVPEGTDMVVNATPMGLFPNVDARLDLNVASLRPGTVAVDVIPNPPRTRFVRDAQERGCGVMDGLACWSDKAGSPSGTGPGWNTTRRG